MSLVLFSCVHVLCTNHVYSDFCWCLSLNSWQQALPVVATLPRLCAPGSWASLQVKTACASDVDMNISSAHPNNEWSLKTNWIKH